MPDNKSEVILQFGEKPQEKYIERFSVYALLLNEKKQLLSLKVKDIYHLPGGGLDEGEDQEVAVKREALEEAGCVIKNLEYLGKANQYFLNSSIGPLNKLATFYKADIVSIDSSMAVETDHQVCWISIDEFLNSHAGDFQKWAVKKLI